MVRASQEGAKVPRRRRILQWTHESQKWDHNIHPIVLRLLFTFRIIYLFPFMDYFISLTISPTRWWIRGCDEFRWDSRNWNSPSLTCERLEHKGEFFIEKKGRLCRWPASVWTAQRCGLTTGGGRVCLRLRLRLRSRNWGLWGSSGPSRGLQAGWLDGYRSKVG